MIGPIHSAPLFLTAFLAFGPFGGCGADHHGARESAPVGTPKPPGGAGGGSDDHDGGGSTTITSSGPVSASEGPAGGTPEPATILLVSGAAAGYGALRLRRRKLAASRHEA